MPKLTTDDEGLPITKIIKKSKGKTKKIVSLLIDDNSKCCSKCDKDKCNGLCCKKCPLSQYDIEKDDLKFLDDYFYKSMKFRHRFNTIQFLNNLIDKKVDKKIYEAARSYINSKKGNEMIIDDDHVFQVIPNYQTREIIYVAGPSGSGKSTFVSKYAQEYRRMFPKNNIYVFSRVSNDKVIDKLNPIRIVINDELTYQPISPEELANSLVIFDDTDTIPNKELKETINALKSDLLETGRHENVYLCITSHLISNYKETRTVLNEAHCIVVFPSAGSTYPIQYVMKNYCGMSKNDIQKSISISSRWLCIRKSYPQMVISTNKCYLLGK